jgi:antitoxin CptB
MSSAGDDAAVRRRKRLKYRSWHRGTKEMDLLLGPFADACLDGFDEDLLTAYERLLERPDPELQDWILERTPSPLSETRQALNRLIAFHAGRRR